MLQMDVCSSETITHRDIIELSISIQKEITKYNTSFVVYCEKPISGALITNDDDDIEFANIFKSIQARKPDLFLIDHENMKCFILEVSCPFDAFIEECYNTKFQKYMPLCDMLTICGFDCKILVFVIGSLGHVHYRFCSGLRKLGFPIRVAKAVAKYTSISAMIGTNIIWKIRNRLTKDK